jgi:hypothetical protein
VNELSAFCLSSTTGLPVRIEMTESQRLAGHGVYLLPIRFAVPSHCWYIPMASIEKNQGDRFYARLDAQTE